MIFGWRARIGQIRPATAIEGAEEWRQVAPEGVAFIDARTRVMEVTEKGLEGMMAQVLEAARQVADAKPDVIVQCGAPGIFLRGYGHDRVVIQQMEEATGVKATYSRPLVRPATNPAAATAPAAARSQKANRDSPGCRHETPHARGTSACSAPR